MDSERFKGIHFLPDPIMGSDDHYIPFTDAYGTITSENERPFLIQRRKIKTLTYSPSEQHARNAGVLVQCDECEKWRLLFCKCKLSARERTQLKDHSRCVLLMWCYYRRFNSTRYTQECKNTDTDP